MGKKEDAKKLVGKMVSAWTATHGTYEGVLEEVVSKPGKPWRGKIRIIGIVKHAAIFESEYPIGAVIEVGNTSIKLLRSSLFGPKPDECPAQFANCGDCNIYPCLIGQPAYNLAVAEREI